MQPHRLHVRVSLCSLGQSASSPSRISSSLHLLHSSTIHPEGSIARSDKMFNAGSEGRSVSFIPLLLFLLHDGWSGPHRTIQSIRGAHGPLGCPPPYDPRGAAIGPTLPFGSLTLRSRFRVAISSPSNRSGSKASPSRQMDLELTPAMCAQDMLGGTCAVIAELLS